MGKLNKKVQNRFERERSKVAVLISKAYRLSQMITIG
jgi:hypothetical protein